MNKEFQTHMLNDAGKLQAKRIADAFDDLLIFLTAETHRGNTPAEVPICPPGRETAILRTKLEEACFFAKKAMASAPGNADVG